MLGELESGLSSWEQPLLMLPSFIEQLPRGTESGCFFALDLGGTNCRAAAVQLGGQPREIAGVTVRETRGAHSMQPKPRH